MEQRETIAIIGAGIAGLSCARALAKQHRWVHCFEKARGPGGRMASRRDEIGSVDHGAVAFRVAAPLFAEAMAEWERFGLVAPWRPRQVTLARGATAHVDAVPERWVGVPRMGMLTRTLAEGLDLRTGTEIAGIEGEAGAWRLRDIRGTLLPGTYPSVVVAVPAPQAVPLLAVVPDLARQAAAVDVAPTWVALLRFVSDLEVPWDEALCEDEILHRVVRDASKPGRTDTHDWVLHAHQAWSRTCVDESPETVLPQLIAAAEALIGRSLPTTSRVVAHRWRYGHVPSALGTPYLFDRAAGIGACGDWCQEGNVEGAWLSGEDLAQVL